MEITKVKGDDKIKQFTREIEAQIWRRQKKPSELKY